jgi:hypothetical protein
MAPSQCDRTVTERDTEVPITSPPKLISPSQFLLTKPFTKDNTPKGILFKKPASTQKSLKSPVRGTQATAAEMKFLDDSAKGRLPRRSRSRDKKQQPRPSSIPALSHHRRI